MEALDVHENNENFKEHSPLSETRSSDLDPSTSQTAKRKFAEIETNNSPQDTKLFKTEKFWDFSLESDVVVMEGAPCIFLPPIPEVEFFRFNLVKQMRDEYQDICKQNEGIDAPQESFNRWLLERKITDKGTDPILPTACCNDVSPAMFREIIHDVPIRISKIKSCSDARRQLFRYGEAAKHMIESRNLSKLVKSTAYMYTQEIVRATRKFCSFLNVHLFLVIDRVKRDLKIALTQSDRRLPANNREICEPSKRTSAQVLCLIIL